MKKKNQKIELKKLKLVKERITTLSTSEMQNVVGGNNEIAYQWSSGKVVCSTRQPTQR